METTEGLQLLFGSKKTIKTYDDGRTVETLEAFHSGNVIGEMVEYCETLKSEGMFAEGEIMTSFLDFQEFINKEPGKYLNPTFKQKTDEKTGRTKIIEKRWTERVK